MPIFEAQPITSIADLRRGDIVRHVHGDQSFVVDAVYGQRATAVRHADITNPAEWVVFREKPVPAPLDERTRLALLTAAGLLTMLQQGIVPANTNDQIAEALDKIGAVIAADAV